ncbi:MAG TPA: hypothetical protein VGR67_03490 [Candidatus Polarisedimenticolia bacterium]|nr:hypothetical protein [Candidatus Polarisedimenticolia bacterium]
MSFDPIVEAIRAALRAVDRDPRSVPAYLDLLQAYQNCADKENEPELLEQAGYVIRDVKQLPLSEEEKRRLADLESQIAATKARLEAIQSQA